MEGLKTGRIYLTGGSHDSEKPNELSFKQGDLITFASELTEDGEHYQAVASDGSMGLIHFSHIHEREPIPVVPMPWFHSAISRLDAEKLLDRNQDGHFLLRISQNTKGVYALAISQGGKICHYLVAMNFTTKKLTLNGEKYFQNLPELVQAHMTDPGSLGTVLSQPVIRRGTLDFYIDQESLKKTWGLPKTEVELGEVLGRGEFGDVCMAAYRGMQVAGKIIHNDKQNAASTASFLLEASILTHLQHKNLVQLIGLVFQGSAMKCILTELMGKGSLQKYLISRGRSVITQAELLSFVRDVCEGMVYMSSQEFVHRDIAARNVLLNNNGQAKISDFGLARKANIYVPHEGGKFPVKWTAPEALKESRFSIKSDVWSYGVFLWEVYSYGRTPYPSVPTDEVLANIEDGLIMDPPDQCPDEIYDLMCVCWEIEPSQRPSFPSIQKQLTRTFQESHTPSSSPKLLTSNPTAMPNINELVNSPIAVEAYQKAPVSRKATMFLGNINFLGLQGAGKTSLLRSLTGKSFRLVEPPSHEIEITENYCLLTDTLNWVSSTSGLIYEEELVRIIVDDLLKHMHTVVNRRNGAKNTIASGIEAPPLPPQRSLSFSDSRGHVCKDSVRDTKASSRFSGSFEVLESNSPEGKLQLGLRPQSVATNLTHHKKGIFPKFLTKSFKNAKDYKMIRRHHSDSVKQTRYIGTSSSANSSPIPPRHYSPLPERLTEKIKAEFDECFGGSLSPKYLARLIDTPGHPSFKILQTLFLTENSVCILAFDTSKDILSPITSSLLQKRLSPEVKHNGGELLSSNIQDSYLCHIMAEISNLCVQWSGFKSDMTICGPRIVLVGTHSDKVPSSVTNRNFEILRDEIKVSPYCKYVSMVKFIVSNSSIIERSSMDDLKQFVKETVKKVCRQQVPLKWLRCVRRFQGFFKKQNYFVSLKEAKKMICEICDIPRCNPEIDNIVNFFHQNQVIMHFPSVYHLKDLVITSPKWFAKQLSAVFGASSIDVAAEPDSLKLIADQELVKSTGVLTNQLLDYVWQEHTSQINKDKLLTVMHKMDLLCCMALEMQPISLSASIEDLTTDIGTKKLHHMKVGVSSIIVPALVEEANPPHLSSLPSYDAEPIVFRYKDHVPSGLFHRLLVRCVQSYPNGFYLYQHAGVFQFDERSIILLTEGQNYIRLTLHHSRKNSTASQPSQNSIDFPDSDSLFSDSADVSPDSCMAILMFIRATISDLTQQWTPHVEFDVCVKCNCKLHPIPMDAVVDIDAALAQMSKYAPSRLKKKSDGHYIILNDVDSLLRQLSLRCEMGNQVPMSASLLCWFGEVLPMSMSPSSPSGDIEYVTDEDINQVLKVLGSSWQELGKTLGFSQVELERFCLMSCSVSYAGKKMLEEWQNLHNRNATFSALLGALEIIQRRDIADDLVAVRMVGSGCDM